MKSMEEVNNIADRCLQVFNEHQCNPIEIYGVIGILRYAADIGIARAQAEGTGNKESYLLGVIDRVDKMAAEGKTKEKVKVE